MKKKSLNLKALKIESFVTSLENNEELTVKGGAMHTCPIPDPEFVTTPCNCNTSFGQICHQIR